MSIPEVSRELLLQRHSLQGLEKRAEQLEELSGEIFWISYFAFLDRLEKTFLFDVSLVSSQYRQDAKTLQIILVNLASLIEPKILKVNGGLIFATHIKLSLVDAMFCLIVFSFSRMSVR